MRRSLLIARANLRRSKAQTAAILVLLLAASAMLNLWLILAMDYKSNFDRCHDRLNAEHVTLVLNGEGNDRRRRRYNRILYGRRVMHGGFISL